MSMSTAGVMCQWVQPVSCVNEYSHCYVSCVDAVVLSLSSDVRLDMWREMQQTPPPPPHQTPPSQAPIIPRQINPLINLRNQGAGILANRKCITILFKIVLRLSSALFIHYAVNYMIYVEPPKMCLMIHTQLTRDIGQG